MPQHDHYALHRMSINPAPNPILLFVGVLFATTLSLSAYVAQVNAGMDPSNPDSWPHMAPERFFLLVPVFALFLSAFAAVVEFVVLRHVGHQLRARGSSSWFWLGVAYGSVLLGYNLAFFLGPGPKVLLVSLLVTSVAVLCAHRFLAAPPITA